MQISTTAEFAALAIMALVHVLGAGVLIWNMLDGSERSLRDLWPRDDDGDGGPGRDDDDGRPGPDGGEPVVMCPPVLADRYGTRESPREPQRVSR